MESKITIALIVVAVLILCVQIIVEILKPIIKVKSEVAYNILVLIVAVVMTLVAAIIGCPLIGIVITWKIIVAAIIVSFFIAYGAMVGYDKLVSRVFSTIKGATDTAPDKEKDGE